MHHSDAYDHGFDSKNYKDFNEYWYLFSWYESYNGKTNTFDPLFDQTNDNIYFGFFDYSKNNACFKYSTNLKITLFNLGTPNPLSFWSVRISIGQPFKPCGWSNFVIVKTIMLTLIKSPSLLITM